MNFNFNIKITSNRGITLTELLVASIMIGIVMLGVASFGVAVKQLQGSTNKSVIVAMRAKAVMARITGDAFLAVGNGVDRGILTFNGGPGQSICFRQDTDNNPITHIGDEWTCYYRDNDDDSLYLCGGPPTPFPANVPVNSDADCIAGGGRLLLIDLDPASPVFYDVVENGFNQIEYVEIIFSALFDNTLTVHDVNNPIYTITTRVSPPGHSR